MVLYCTVLNTIKSILLILFILLCAGFVKKPDTEEKNGDRDAPTFHIKASPNIETLEKETSKKNLDQVQSNIGITYFSYFYGPGLHPEKLSMSPNQLGRPEHDGINSQNQVSLRFKFSNNLAVDFQNRFRIIFNNGKSKPDFNPFRWESPRIGISGRLASGNEWSLIGAVNTDFPCFMPAPFTGYQAQARTVILDPGMFAGFKYEPTGSRWSVFSVVSPRVFFYGDRNAIDQQSIDAGSSAGNKPEVLIAFQPTLNYRVASNTSITLGATIDYRKHVLSDWNLFNASLVTNSKDPSWKLSAVPVVLGVTYVASNSISIFPFISVYPIAAQRIDADTGLQANLLESTSLGMWIRGTLF